MLHIVRMLDTVRTHLEGGESHAELVALQEAVELLETRHSATEQSVESLDEEEQAIQECTTKAKQIRQSVSSLLQSLEELCLSEALFKVVEEMLSIQQACSTIMDKLVGMEEDGGVIKSWFLSGGAIYDGGDSDDSIDPWDSDDSAGWGP